MWSLGFRVQDSGDLGFQGLGLLGLLWLRDFEDGIRHFKVEIKGSGS